MLTLLDVLRVHRREVSVLSDRASEVFLLVQSWLGAVASLNLKF
jgi:hypothetical protein